jgi:hypothetical protein
MHKEGTICLSLILRVNQFGRYATDGKSYFVIILVSAVSGIKSEDFV